jgi:phage-related protein, tail component|nr:MAG TPA: membrane protein [Caudoviricetes sp.]
MGFFSKKVKRNKWIHGPLLGDPVESIIKKKTKEYSMFHRDMMGRMVSNKYRKISDYENMKDLIFYMNNSHNKEWLRLQTDYVETRTMYYRNSKPNSEILAAFNTGGTNLQYTLDGTSDLAIEYWLSKQVSYGFTTKTFNFGIYKFQYITDTKVKCIYRKPNPPLPLPPYVYIFQLGEEVELSDTRLNLYPSMDIYIEKVYKPLLRAKLLTDFGVDYNDTTKEVLETEFIWQYTPQSNPLVDDRMFHASAYYTWKDHTTEEMMEIPDKHGNIQQVPMQVPKYELIEVYHVFPQFMFDMWKETKDIKPVYVEWIDTNNKRQITKFNSMPEGFRHSFAKKERFSAIIPLKGQDHAGSLVRSVPDPSDKKKYRRWKLAVEQPQYKKRSTKREQKKGKGKSKDAFTALQENGQITNAGISQFIDMRWFFRKKLRNNRFWQRYLLEIFQYFEEFVAPAKYGKDADRVDIDMWFQNTFGLQLVKRKIRNTPCSKRCLLGIEKETNALYIYLNKPVDGEKHLETFRNFTQYGINLSAYFRVNMSVNTTPILDSVVTDFITNFDPFKGVEEASFKDYQNTWKTLGGNRDILQSGLPRLPNTKPYYDRLLATQDYTIDPITNSNYNDLVKALEDAKGEKTVYIPFPLIENTTDDTSTIAEYEVKYKKTWAYTGLGVVNTPIDKDGVIHRIKVIDKNTGKVLGTLVYKLVPDIADKNGKIDLDGFDTIPGSVTTNDNVRFLWHMPRKFWLKIPFVVQTEIAAGVLYVLCRAEWEEKKATFFGKIFGAILIVIGIVIGVFAGWTGIGAAWAAGFIGAGISYYGAMYNIMALKILGLVVSLYSAYLAGAATAASSEVSRGMATSAVASQAAAGTSATMSTGASVGMSSYLSTGLTVANTAMSVMNMYQSYKTEKILKRERASTGDYIEDQNRKANELSHEMLSNYLDLTLYDIERPDQEMDLFFYLAFGGYDFDRIAKGAIYTELQQPLYSGELYDRLK